MKIGLIKEKFIRKIGSIPPTLSIMFLFVALMLVAYPLKQVSSRVDLTEDKIYTLSDGSIEILKSLDRQVTIRYYVNKSNNILPFVLRNYAERVNDFLAQLEQVSGGKVKVVQYDPEPDSDAAISAELDGIQSHPVSPGVEGYMGLSLSCLDQKRVIPFLDLKRENTLEYDILRMLSEVAQFSRKRIAVYSGVPALGIYEGKETIIPEWSLFKELRHAYDILHLTGKETEIADDVKVLMLLHPKELDYRFEAAVDRFLQGGGQMVVMLDPLAFSFMFYGQGYVTENVSSSWPALERATGITFNADETVLDKKLKTALNRGEGMEQLSFILSLDDSVINTELPMANQMSKLVFASSGYFSGEPHAGITKTVVAQSSQDSMLTPIGKVMDAGKHEAEQLNRDFKADKNIYDLAIMLEGKVSSLKSGKTEPNTQSSRILLLADTDFASDPFAGRSMPVQGRHVFYPENNNVGLIINSIDFFVGTSNLMDARSKTRRSRPLTKLVELERLTEVKYEEKLKTLDSLSLRLDRELDVARNTFAKDDSNSMRSLETEGRIEYLASQLKSVQLEARMMRRQLRQDVDTIKTKVIAFNIGLSPFLVAIIGGIVLLRRHYKTRPR